MKDLDTIQGFDSIITAVRQTMLSFARNGDKYVVLRRASPGSEDIAKN